ncbi:sigma-70 family RNA polymerase sigma factor [Halomonas saccharevitans]|uniref:Sigma-70 family RNA polymerase sigma factor n=1 Tax=Halomonas saccharevitans TaxID=416872 RepID=A0ABU3ND46_9GAMM|nr:sigma-70 family RNA polymerase sigma factor [Halomonas saccharevitans]MDT8878550.1 sigma-70 family RNA polymerase sigma factor [Halomonas saccharevitans]
MRRAFPCIESAWQAHRDELRGFLIRHSGDQDTADDLLQSVYTQALTHRQQFCKLDSPRAWLFRVARHQWIDQQRRDRRWTDQPPPEIAEESPPTSPLVSLINCIEHAMPHLEAKDRDILRRCDLEGLRQADYADDHGLRLPATKARLRRARQRLRQRLIAQCGIVFDEKGDICCHRADRG